MTTKKAILLISAGFFFLLIALGGAGYYFFIHQQATNGEQTEMEEEEDPSMTQEEMEAVTFKVEDLTVKLDSSRPQHAILAFSIQLSDEETQEAFAVSEAEIRNRILGILSTKTEGELRGTENLNNITQEIQSDLGNMLDQGEIENVFITTLTLS